VGWDSELPLLAYDHAKEAFVPTLDDLTPSESEFERFIVIARGVEDGTGGVECSSIIHLNLIAIRRLRQRLGARWNGESLDREFGWWWCGGHWECE